VPNKGVTFLNRKCASFSFFHCIGSENAEFLEDDLVNKSGLGLESNLRMT